MRAVGRIVPVDPDTQRGTAFAVGARLALTAAHCVGGRVGAAVDLAFEAGPTVHALARAVSALDDLALLELETDLTAALAPVELLDVRPVLAAEMLAGDPFWLEGFGRDAPPGSNVHTVDGEIVNADAKLFDPPRPVIQLRSDHFAAGENPHQFSGGPVLVRAGVGGRRGAIGVAAWANVHAENPTLAVGGGFYAVPVWRAADEWPEIAALVLPFPGSRDRVTLSVRSRPAQAEETTGLEAHLYEADWNPLLDRLVDPAAGPEVELHVADLDDAFGVYERHLEAAELPAEQRRAIRRQLVSMRNTQADVNHLVGWAIRTFLAAHRYSDAEIATILDRAVSLEINDLLFYLGSPKAPPSRADTEMFEFIFGVAQTDFVYLGFDTYDGRGGLAEVPRRLLLACPALMCLADLAPGREVATRSDADRVSIACQFAQVYDMTQLLTAVAVRELWRDWVLPQWLWRYGRDAAIDVSPSSVKFGLG